MTERLDIVIAHILPGRLRMCLSPPPKAAERIIQIIQSHPGVSSVLYSPITQSLIVQYYPEEVATEEVILRASLALSKDYDLRPVRIRSRETKAELSSLSMYAGLFLLFNHGLNVFVSKSKNLAAFTVANGIITLAAVMDHLVQDLKERGQIHPEVFSIYFLIASFLKGNVLKGSSITWLLTFARHMFEKPSGVLVVRTVKVDPACHLHHCEYEVTVSKEEAMGGFSNLLRILPQIALNAYREVNLEDSLFQQIQAIAESHEDIIEGLENLQQGVYLKVQA
jgi:hypothetical protein